MQQHAVTIPAISDAPPNNRGAFPCVEGGDGLSPPICLKPLILEFVGMHANKVHVSPYMLWHTTWRAKLTRPLTPRGNNRNDNARNRFPKKRIKVTSLTRVFFFFFINTFTNAVWRWDLIKCLNVVYWFNIYNAAIRQKIIVRAHFTDIFNPFNRFKSLPQSF